MRTVSPSRLLLAPLLAAFAAAVLLAGPARAESVIVVVDRGQGARAGSVEQAALTLRVAAACQARGDSLRVMAVGARANGKPRVLDLRVPLEAQALADLDAKEGTAFDGPSDARAALAAALRGSTPREPVTLILVGPFGKVEPVPEGAGFALESWNRTAPAGSRILPLSLSADGAALLASAKGFQARGTLVLALGPASALPEPWSAFAESAVLTAEVRVPVVRAAWGGGDGSVDGADLELPLVGGEGDTLTRLPAQGDVRRWRLEHAQVKGLKAALRFEPPRSTGPVLLAAAPGALEVAWAEVKPEVRWLAEGGAAPQVTAADLERGRPREARFAYRRTATAEPSGWLSVVEREDAAQALPAEVGLRAEGERRVTPFVVEGEAVLTLTPGAPRAGRFAGRVVLEPQGPGAGAPLAVAYALAYLPAKVTAALTGPEQPVKLPPSSLEKPLTLRVEAANANAPEAVDLAWTSALADLSLRVRRGDQEEVVWRSREAFRFQVGAVYALRFAAPDRPAWGHHERGPKALVLAPVPVAGVDVACTGSVAYRAREPAWRVDAADARYRADAQDPRDERPLRAVLDADGGDGAWLAWRLEQAPPLEQVADSPQRFAVVSVGPGRVELRREGPWKGGRGGIFTDRVEEVEVGFPEPKTLQRLPVLVPARWGAMGYVLAGLAGLAALLGLFAWRLSRVLPVGGTLLYTTEGRPGAVGRLPLLTVGRRRTPITLDGQGRLTLRGSGPLLARILPTRVGGMLEVQRDGGRTERRLLVDGLTVSLGRHALRYVQGTGEGAPPPPEPGAVPDLLGPEYDLPTSTDDAPPGSTGPGEGGAPPGSSPRP